ncbi:hypothetical protein NDU88_003805 [Pleurodeles waltl]|uniref:Uncharacterized protein n=1 Tax=Pleurodeles waltl TaxID=8319 RepID=A0AAV7KZJ8_PLEWA|nr:hypothetical protein NDU88_003805 [Pleurodeles waltl]
MVIVPESHELDDSLDPSALADSDSSSTDSSNSEQEDAPGPSCFFNPPDCLGLELVAPGQAPDPMCLVRKR